MSKKKVLVQINEKANTKEIVNLPETSTTNKPIDLEDWAKKFNESHRAAHHGAAHIFYRVEFV